jgi:trigger factor
MQVSVENTGGLGRRMTVQVPAEQIDREVDSRLQSMRATIRLDGFRPGKVPLGVVVKKYGTRVRREVMEQIIHSTLQDALARESLQPAAEPRIEPVESLPGQSLQYVATFEVFPELTAPLDYGFRVVRPVVQIGDADVDGMLEKLRRQRATWRTVDRAARKEDQVVIDFEGTVEGRAFSGGTAKNIPLVLGSGTMVSGFEEQLVGTLASQDRIVRVTFPADYPSREIGGKEVEFAVKVHSVSEMVLPELDDEFARAFGVAEKGMEGLRQEVAANMQRELKQLIKSNLKDQVFSALLERNPVEVPRSLVSDEAVRLRTRASSSEAANDSVLEHNAERRVKLGVLVTAIVRQNRIQVDPGRVRETVESIAASYEKPEEVVQWYYGKQEMLGGVQSAVMEDQVVDWVLEHSGVLVDDETTTFDRLVDAAKQSKG